MRKQKQNACGEPLPESVRLAIDATLPLTVTCQRAPGHEEQTHVAQIEHNGRVQTIEWHGYTERG